MEPPTQFELDLVCAAVEGVKVRYPVLAAQVPHLRVRGRELTGVGGYVCFDLPPGVPEGEPHLSDTVLTPGKMVETDHPPSGLGFAVGVTGGRIDSLEIFTYGDERWDGSVGRYRIVAL